MNNDKILIGIITCNRPKSLQRCIQGLSKLDLDCNIHVDILIIDNSQQLSAKYVYDEINIQANKFQIFYTYEPQAGIPYARNAAIYYTLKNDYSYLAFIDDDEIPDSKWLCSLYNSLIYYQADIVHGKVVKIFSDNSQKLFNDLHVVSKPKKTGQIIDRAATNNILIKREILKNIKFDEALALTGGSDTLFTRQAVKKGATIIHCNESIVYEYQEKIRERFIWIFKRHYRMGLTAVHTEKVINGCLYIYTILASKAILQFPRGLFLLIIYSATGNNPLKAILPIARGIGIMSGLFGIKYYEYKSRHKFI